MTVFLDPTITDISRIAATIGSLKSLSLVMSYALIGFLVPLEMIHQQLNAIEGKNNMTGVFIRIGLVFVGLLLYDRIFGFIVKASTIMELSILSEQRWSDLLAELAQFFQTRKLTLVSSLPMVFTWIASFLALLVKNILYWVRYCLLSVLYFIGPIAFAFHIYNPTSFLPQAWFKNVIQLSLWTVVMKIIVRVMLELQVMTYLATANSEVDVLTLVGINTTFVVMIVFSPYFTAQFISGQTIGPFAVMASSVIATKTLMLLKGVGRTTAAVAAGPYMPDPQRLARTTTRIFTASKTMLRDHIQRRREAGKP